VFWYPVPEYARVSHIEFPPYVTGNNIFSPQEMDAIIDRTMKAPGQAVKTGPDLKLRPEENRSTQRHLLPSQENHWIYQRIMNTLAVLNAQSYQFDVKGMDEPLYFVTYESKDKGHYNWHYDGTPAGHAPRKLSITFQLSDPKDYEGGELEFNRTGNPTTAPKDRGTFVLFPSFILHRVRPVTKGIRHALVAWVNGPPLR
jgi:PKHD-type hydroxylase